MVASRHADSSVLRGESVDVYHDDFDATTVVTSGQNEITTTSPVELSRLISGDVLDVTLN